MKKYLFYLILVIHISGFAQNNDALPENQINAADIESDIRFLASDELMGRKPGHYGNDIAARYIAEQFRKSGVKPFSEAGYFQEVELTKTMPSKTGKIGKDTLQFNLNEDFIQLAGLGIDVQNAQIIQLPYAFTSTDGNYDDFKNIDVKGKVIIAQMGTPDATNPQQIFGASREKRKLAQAQGAIALIEIYTLPIPWTTVKGFFGKENYTLTEKDSGSEITHIWLNYKKAKSYFESIGNTIDMQIAPAEHKSIYTKNVVGFIEGTNPKLKSEFVALTAHFDHIGFGKTAGNITESDSIFNGARDNAIGTAAVLAAAKNFSQFPTERSILLIAYTAEELGLLGSKYYAQNPLVPMNTVIFNLNTDGAGYNSKEKITVIGLDRTTAEDQIIQAGAEFGLEVINDPVPEQGLFDRSDNVNFAAVGVPAPDFSPGLTAFDAEIGKYYHKAADNPETLDFEYIQKFCQSFVYAGRLIANNPIAPSWKIGDKYEKAFKTLYNK